MNNQTASPRLDEEVFGFELDFSHQTSAEEGEEVSIHPTKIVQSPPRVRSDRGFSMVEMLLVIAVIGIVTVMALVAWFNEMPVIRADSAYQLLEAQLRQAREMAVDKRDNVVVTFKGVGETMVVQQLKSDTAATYTVTGTNTLSDIILDPNQMTFAVLTGVPDTPDGFGDTTTCVTSSGICFKDTVSNVSACGTVPVLPCSITFQSDGTVVDSSGNYVNGTVFMGQVGNAPNPTNVMTARAVTILGSTGRIKGYRYTGKTWY